MKVIQANITTLSVDAIVNAANSTLLGGGGVDGAIHRAAGAELLAECAALKGCCTGDVRMTNGYHLPARFVIHAVGPVWQNGTQGESEQLASCYRRSLLIAQERSFASIAFPCISTGAYGFPSEQAARIAIQAVRETLREFNSAIEVIFCCFSNADCALYQRLLEGEANEAV